MENQNHKMATHLQALNQQIGEADALASKSSEPETPQDREFINSLFDRLFAICSAWSQSYAGMDKAKMDKAILVTKREWFNSIKLERISNGHVIDYAVNKVKESGNPFMPTIGVFIGWCREGNTPEGTKGLEDSYREIQGYLQLPIESRKLGGLNPEVYNTLHNLGDFYGFRHANEEKAKKLWFTEHERTLEALRSGKSIVSAPPDRIKIASNNQPINKERAISGLQAMRDSLKCK